MDKPFHCQKCPRYFDSQKGLSMHTYYKHKEELLKASPPTTTLTPSDTTYWSKKRRPDSLYGPIINLEYMDPISTTKKDPVENEVNVPKNVFNDNSELKKWRSALNEYDEEMKSKRIRLNEPKNNTSLNADMSNGKAKSVKRLKTTKSELNEDKRKCLVRLSYKLAPLYDLLDVFEVKKLITEICSVNTPDFELTSEEQLLVDAMSTCSSLLDISIIIRARSETLTTLLKKCYMS